MRKAYLKKIVEIKFVANVNPKLFDDHVLLWITTFHHGNGFACLGGWSSLCPNERDYENDYILLLSTNYILKNDVEAKQGEIIQTEYQETEAAKLTRVERIVICIVF